ncbi:MAG: DUF6323 family protein [Emergencia sp.]
MEKKFMAMMLQETQRKDREQLLACNQMTQDWGLQLTEEDAAALAAARQTALEGSGRIEFDGGIMPELIRTFCDSPYLQQDSYAQTLGLLQEAFYQCKSEAMELLTDRELLDFMREYFDDPCRGDAEYLISTWLDRFTRAVRRGFQTPSAYSRRDEYTLSAGCPTCREACGSLQEEEGWSYELFVQTLENME